MSDILRNPGFLQTTFILLRREVAGKLGSPWFYVVASVICMLAWAFGAGFAQTFETESALVTTDPLMPLNIMVVSFLAIVLGLRLASSIAWEREHRTLEVLVVGPVPFEAIALAKFLAELCVFAALLAIYFAYLLLAQPLGAGVIDSAGALSAGQMPLHALPTLALGLLVSALSRSVRGAVLVYLAIVVFLGVFEIVRGVLLSRPPEQLSLGAAYLRSALQSAARMLDPASAIAQLANLTRGLAAQEPLLAADALHALILTALTIGLAAVLSRVRGALA
jgi:ABC-type transport system involved in multi-copper enzyme maturation permease subunit